MVRSTQARRSSWTSTDRYDPSFPSHIRRAILTVYQATLTGSQDVSVAIGLLSCVGLAPSGSCDGVNPAGNLGRVLFSGPYAPTPVGHGHADLAQNYTVQVPSNFELGHALLAVAHFGLIIVSLLFCGGWDVLTTVFRITITTRHGTVLRGRFSAGDRCWNIGREWRPYLVQAASSNLVHRGLRTPCSSRSSVYVLSVTISYESKPTLAIVRQSERCQASRNLLPCGSRRPSSHTPQTKTF